MVLHVLNDIETQRKSTTGSGGQLAEVKDNNCRERRGQRREKCQKSEIECLSVEEFSLDEPSNQLRDRDRELEA